MTSTFFHFALRRETGFAVSRSSEEKSYYIIMKASWVYVFLILTLLGLVFASRNTDTEGKSWYNFERNHLFFDQSGMSLKERSKRVLKFGHFNAFS